MGNGRGSVIAGISPAGSFDATKGGENMLELFRKEHGQTMAEYAVILGVIALAIVLALGVLSTAISSAISTVAGYV